MLVAKHQLLPFITLLCFAAASGKQKQPFQAGRGALLVPRGGGTAMIDPELAGKLLTTAYLVQGTSLALAPKPVMEAYGMKKDTSELCQICAGALGGYITAFGVVGYALLVNNASNEGAIGAGIATFLMFDQYRAYLLDFPAQHGMNQYGLVFNILFLAATVYALLTNQDYASGMTKALCLYGAVNSVFGCLDPKTFATVWGIKETEIDKEYLYIIRKYCWYTIAFCTMTWMLLFTDASSLNSLGYGTAVVLSGVVSQNFVTKDVGELKLSPVPQFAWMLFFSILAASILM